MEKILNFRKCRFCDLNLPQQEKSDTCLPCQEQMQIDFLNNAVKVKIGVSKIHGVGMIAIRDIKAGEKLYAEAYPQVYRVPYRHFIKLKPEIARLILEQWPQVVNGEAFMWPTCFLAAHMNHADNPNYDAKKDIVLRDILEGEEITENYRFISGHEKIFTWLKN